jgi:ribonuclease VapC
MLAVQVALDSHALLRLLRDEPGAEAVSQLLEKASQRDQAVHMTEVNYAEVQYIIRRKDGDAVWAAIAGELRAAPIEFHPATRPLADLAAGFKARFRLSLADAFAAALAKEMKAELVTGDPEFKALEKEIRIQWPK